MISTQGFPPHIPSDYLDRMLSILTKIPEENIKGLRVSKAIVEFWKKAPVKTLPKDRYLNVWDRLWAAFVNDGPEPPNFKTAVSYAINDPAGELTEELLKYLWPKDAKIGGGIPTELADRLKKIVDGAGCRKIDASSLIVVSRAEVLHAVAPDFTKDNILPLLSWSANPSAAAYWHAFLWPARISPDLFKLLEADCLTALKDPDQFEHHAYEILCQLFLLASMEFKATTEQTVREAFDNLEITGLERMSKFLRQRMLNSKEDPAEYWLQTVKPWIGSHWPREQTRQSQQTMENFALIAIYSKGNFPKAFRWLDENGLLGETPTASMIVSSLSKDQSSTYGRSNGSSTLPEQFPDEVLCLLERTRPFLWANGEALAILDRIRHVKPELAQTAKYKAIEDLLR
ncbi:hypothetical protein GOZ97_17585 [Agrobacterium vitis]|uniref:hypothetical protein n=1 Tax=Rhizobium/Agrobacterium group TaxID=227290 RepID=UPI0008DBF693|nr:MULTISPECIES: hypothetical protein [Rhizobium/Agrobacterium group]MCF1433401.1 hypothetical protein [Allorhizobium ampelinum]MUO91394.1 hypothetical protein [Agrobacterium vitis]MUZ54501.1 hypothetical protein [Agrobacterium vitis]MUZ93240.1 hypothetical protein [Agrobacterium vitis]OHZ36182.1 hypothetical protein BBL07_16945 [Agrobacterium vitis]